MGLTDSYAYFLPIHALYQIVSIKLCHNNDAVEHTLVAIFNHLLEVWTVVRLGELRPVYVVADDLDIVEVGVVHTLSELAFNTRLILFFR